MYTSANFSTDNKLYFKYNNFNNFNKVTLYKTPNNYYYAKIKGANYYLSTAVNTKRTSLWILQDTTTTNAVTITNQSDCIQIKSNNQTYTLTPPTYEETYRTILFSQVSQSKNFCENLQYINKIQLIDAQS